MGTSTGSALPQAVDGKSVSGTFTRAGGAGLHLPAALRHDLGTVAAPRHPTRPLNLFGIPT